MGPLLAIDTATRRCCLCLGDPAGNLLAERVWTVGQRHEETLLPELDALLAGATLRPAELGAIVAGIGPGAFTGTRIGLATAKTLAHGLGVPLVGIATTLALGHAARRADAAAGHDERHVTVLLPAGPSDRYLARVGLDGGTTLPLEPPRLAGPLGIALRDSGDLLVAVDLEPGGGVDEAAVALGARAQAGLGAALLALGAAELGAGRSADAAALAPAYVSLPRGAVVGGEAWSPDLG
jgi:tRNA threonylcarbamoyladenosine biosynthesis protein TsaB